MLQTAEERRDGAGKRSGRPKGSRKRTPKPPPEADFVLVARNDLASWGDALSEAAILLASAAYCAKSAKRWERAATTLSRKVTSIRGMLAPKGD